LQQNPKVREDDFTAGLRYYKRQQLQKSLKQDARISLRTVVRSIVQSKIWRVQLTCSNIRVMIELSEIDTLVSSPAHFSSLGVHTFYK